MRKTAIFLLLAKFLFAATVAEWITPKEKVFIHQIFHVDLRYLKSSDTKITLTGGNNVKFIASIPAKSGDIYEIKRYYFKALSSTLTIPKALVSSTSYSTFAPSLTLQAFELKPPAGFCDVLAKSMRLLNYEAVQYNKDLNLVVLKIEAEFANLEDFSLPFAKKEGIKKLDLLFPKATLIYYAIIPSTISSIKFYYFDTKNFEFKPITISIDVVDETVSTQSDIKPSEDKNKKIKVLLIAIVTFLFLSLYIWKKSIVFLILAVVCFFYGVYLLIPIEKVCVKKGSKIYILPTKQSTVFEINDEKKVYEALKHVGDYVKIKLSKERVGWVKDEDICKD